MNTYLERIEHLVEKVEDWSALPAEPLVSVCMITYNHEAFIQEALDGIMMQVTSFPFEVVIGEDKSTDRTREIVQEYQRRHLDRIRLRLARENLYSQGMKPLAGVFNACRGKYVALCEGDDYWTDPHKLQKQVDYLEVHLECSLCFHHVYKLFQATGKMVAEEQGWQQPCYILDDVISMKLGVPTVSVMLRNGIIPELPAWFHKVPVGDTPLFALLAEHGKLGMVDQTMAVYRVHGGGIWQGSSELARTRMNRETLLALRAHFGHRHERLFRIPISNNYLNQARLSADLGDVANAKTYIKKSISTSFTLRGKWVDQVAMLGRLYLPRGYELAKRIMLVR